MDTEIRVSVKMHSNESRFAIGLLLISSTHRSRQFFIQCHRSGIL